MTYMDQIQIAGSSEASTAAWSRCHCGHGVMSVALSLMGLGVGKIHHSMPREKARRDKTEKERLATRLQHPLSLKLALRRRCRTMSASHLDAAAGMTVLTWACPQHS